MEENNEPLISASEKKPKQGYYKTDRRKALDFLFGFFLALIGGVESFFIAPNQSFTLPVVIGALVLLSAVSFIFKRKFISLGIIIALLFPLLVFGGCFLLLSSANM